MNRSRRLLCTALLVGFAGCSGQNAATPPGSSGLPPMSPNAASQMPQNAALQNAGAPSSENATVSTAAVGTAKFVIKVPSSATAAKSESISTNGGTPVVHNFSATTPGCVAATSTTPLTCTVSLSAPAAADVFTVKTFSAANGTGTVVATGTIAQKIVPATITMIDVILGGAASKIALALKSTSPRECDPAVTIPLTATVKDAAGNFIVGTYSNPVTLSDSDASGTTTLSANTIAASNSTVSLAYNGHLLQSATISATAAGVSGVNVSPAILKPQQMLYVRSGGDSVTVFPLTANGPNLPPTRSLIDNTHLNGAFNAGMVLGPDCVLNAFSSFTNSAKAAQYAIFEYAAGGNGKVTPIASITGSNTGLTGQTGNHYIDGMALDSGGNLYLAARYTHPATSSVYPAILVFAAGASGNVAPAAVIYGSNTQLITPGGVAIDSTGKIYVADSDSILIFAARSTGNVAPVGRINGANTQLTAPMGIAFDQTGRLYVSNWCAGSGPNVTAYASGATGNATPVETISLPSGSGTYFSNCAAGLAIDYSGNLFTALAYESTSGSGGIDAFAAHGTSNVTMPKTSFRSNNVQYPAALGI